MTVTTIAMSGISDTNVDHNIYYLSHHHNEGIPVPVIADSYMGGAEYAHLTRAGILINAEFLLLPPLIFNDLANNIVHDYQLNRALNLTMMVEPVPLHRVVPETVGVYDRWRKGDASAGVVGTVCLICRQDFKSNEKIRKVHNNVNCVYHTKCIARWFKEKPTCPGCNGLVASHPSRVRETLIAPTSVEV